MKKILYLGCSLLFTLQAQCFENSYLMRSPQGLLMGDAYTAVNDDDFTLFYNPASLARHKRDFTLHPLNPQFHGTNILQDMNRFSDMPNSASGAADVLMDYPVHASAGISPGFKLFNVGVSFLASESYDVLLRNQTHPTLDLDLRADKGVLMGVGVPLGAGRITRKSQSGHQTSLGFTAKYLERTGVRDSVGLLSPTVLNALSKDELSLVLKSIGQVKGVGWGFDAGVEHITRSGPSQFVFGLTALDITGTEFTEGGQNSDKLQVSDIKDQVNLAMAFGQDHGMFHYILSADVRALNDQIDFTQRLRLGAQIGIPGIKLMGGLNSGYYSYGAMINLGVLKLMTGFYNAEIGSRSQQIKSSRFLVYLSLFDFSFDS